MKLKFAFASIFIAAACFYYQTTFSQCNAFTKKKCLPNLAPFVHNGQLNSAMLMAGESAELQLTFYSGQQYRLMVCAQEILGDVTFKLKDNTNKVIYNSADHKTKNFWEFDVKSTQQLTVEVVAPESKSPNNLSQSGCISVLIGFKK